MPTFRRGRDNKSELNLTSSFIAGGSVYRHHSGSLLAFYRFEEPFEVSTVAHATDAEKSKVVDSSGYGNHAAFQTGSYGSSTHNPHPHRTAVTSPYNFTGRQKTSTVLGGPTALMQASNSETNQVRVLDFTSGSSERVVLPQQLARDLTNNVSGRAWPHRELYESGITFAGWIKLHPVSESDVYTADVQPKSTTTLGFLNLPQTKLHDETLSLTDSSSRTVVFTFDQSSGATTRNSPTSYTLGYASVSTSGGQISETGVRSLVANAINKANANGDLGITATPVGGASSTFKYLRGSGGSRAKAKITIANNANISVGDTITVRSNPLGAIILKAIANGDTPSTSKVSGAWEFEIGSDANETARNISAKIHAKHRHSQAMSYEWWGYRDFWPNSPNGTSYDGSTNIVSLTQYWPGKHGNLAITLSLSNAGCITAAGDGADPDNNAITTANQFTGGKDVESTLSMASVTLTQAIGGVGGNTVVTGSFYTEDVRDAEDITGVSTPILSKTVLTLNSTPTATDVLKLIGKDEWGDELEFQVTFANSGADSTSWSGSKVYGSKSTYTGQINAYPDGAATTTYVATKLAALFNALSKYSATSADNVVTITSLVHDTAYDLIYQPSSTADSHFTTHETLFSITGSFTGGSGLLKDASVKNNFFAKSIFTGITGSLSSGSVGAKLAAGAGSDATGLSLRVLTDPGTNKHNTLSWYATHFNESTDTTSHDVIEWRTSKPLPDDVWTHVAVVYPTGSNMGDFTKAGTVLEGETSPVKPKIFINGIKQSITSIPQMKRARAAFKLRKGPEHLRGIQVTSEATGSRASAFFTYDTTGPVSGSGDRWRSFISTHLPTAKMSFSNESLPSSATGQTNHLALWDVTLPGQSITDASKTGGLSRWVIDMNHTGSYATNALKFEGGTSFLQKVSPNHDDLAKIHIRYGGLFASTGSTPGEGDFIRITTPNLTTKTYRFTTGNARAKLTAHGTTQPQNASAIVIDDGVVSTPVTFTFNSSESTPVRSSATSYIVPTSGISSNSLAMFKKLYETILFAKEHGDIAVTPHMVTTNTRNTHGQDTMVLIQDNLVTSNTASPTETGTTNITIVQFSSTTMASGRPQSGTSKLSHVKPGVMSGTLGHSGSTYDLSYQTSVYTALHSSSSLSNHFEIGTHVEQGVTLTEQPAYWWATGYESMGTIRTGSFQPACFDQRNGKVVDARGLMASVPQDTPILVFGPGTSKMKLELSKDERHYAKQFTDSRRWLKCKEKFTSDCWVRFKAYPGDDRGKVPYVIHPNMSNSPNGLDGLHVQVSTDGINWYGSAFTDVSGSDGTYPQNGPYASRVIKAQSIVSGTGPQWIDYGEVGQYFLERVVGNVAGDDAHAGYQWREYMFECNWENISRTLGGEMTLGASGSDGATPGYYVRIIQKSYGGWNYDQWALADITFHGNTYNTYGETTVVDVPVKSGDPDATWSNFVAAMTGSNGHGYEIDAQQNTKENLLTLTLNSPIGRINSSTGGGHILTASLVRDIDTSAGQSLQYSLNADHSVRIENFDLDPSKSTHYRMGFKSATVRNRMADIAIKNFQDVYQTTSGSTDYWASVSGTFEAEGTVRAVHNFTAGITPSITFNANKGGTSTLLAPKQNSFFGASKTYAQGWTATDWTIRAGKTIPIGDLWHTGTNTNVSNKKTFLHLDQMAARAAEVINSFDLGARAILSSSLSDTVIIEQDVAGATSDDCKLQVVDEWFATVTGGSPWIEIMTGSALTPASSGSNYPSSLSFFGGNNKPIHPRGPLVPVDEMFLGTPPQLLGYFARKAYPFGFDLPPGSDFSTQIPELAGRSPKAQMDDLAFWKRCLEDEEIHALYHAKDGTFTPKSGFMSNPPRVTIREQDETNHRYPTISRFGDKDFKGRYNLFYDASHEEIFHDPYAKAEILFKGRPKDGTWIELKDWAGRVKRFEFNYGKIVRSGNVEVAIHNERTAAQVAKVLIDIINSLSGFGIRAEVGSKKEAVFLKQTKAGTEGNTPIRNSRKDSKRLSRRSIRAIIPSNFVGGTSSPKVVFPYRLEKGHATIRTAQPTPNAVSDLLVSGSSHKNSLTSPIVHHWEEDSLSPYDESSAFAAFGTEQHASSDDSFTVDTERDQEFYATGTLPTLVGHGLHGPLWSKRKIEVDLTPKKSTTLHGHVVTGSTMAYFNFSEKTWEPIGYAASGSYWLPRRPGLGADGLTGGISSLSSSLPQATIYSVSASSIDGEPAAYSGFRQWLDKTYVGFSPSIGLMIANSTSSVAAARAPNVDNQGKYVFVDGGLSTPVSTFGFPFHPKYHATSSQYLKVSDYIDRPFLLEKIVYEFDASVHQSCSIDIRNNGQTGASTSGSYGSSTSYNQHAYMNAPTPTFFMLNQRQASLPNAIANKVDVVTVVDGENRQQDFHYTASLPSRFYLSPAATGDEPQYVNTIRDLVTFGRYSVFPAAFNDQDFESYVPDPRSRIDTVIVPQESVIGNAQALFLTQSITLALPARSPKVNPSITTFKSEGDFFGNVPAEAVIQFNAVPQHQSYIKLKDSSGDEVEFRFKKTGQWAWDLASTNNYNSTNNCWDINMTNLSTVDDARTAASRLYEAIARAGRGEASEAEGNFSVGMNLLSTGTTEAGSFSVQQRVGGTGGNRSVDTDGSAYYTSAFSNTYRDTLTYLAIEDASNTLTLTDRNDKSVTFTFSETANTGSKISDSAYVVALGYDGDADYYNTVGSSHYAAATALSGTIELARKNGDLDVGFAIQASGSSDTLYFEGLKNAAGTSITSNKISWQTSRTPFIASSFKGGKNINDDVVLAWEGGRSGTGLMSGRSPFGGEYGAFAPAYTVNSNTQTYVVSQSAEDSLVSPYLIMPGDKLIFGWQSPIGTGSMVHHAVSEPDGTFELLPGKGKIVLYGSVLRNEVEDFSNTSNQPLTSNALHEALHYGAEVYDQYDTDPPMFHSGTYLDNHVSGNMHSNVSKSEFGNASHVNTHRQVVSRRSDGNHGIGPQNKNARIFQKRSGFIRGIRVADARERWYDSMLPDVSDLLKVDGKRLYAPSFGTKGDHANSEGAALILGHPKVATGSSSEIGPNDQVWSTWFGAFPFEPRYSNVTRTAGLKTKDVFAPSASGTLDTGTKQLIHVWLANVTGSITLPGLYTTGGFGAPNINMMSTDMLNIIDHPGLAQDAENQAVEGTPQPNISAYAIVTNDHGHGKTGEHLDLIQFGKSATGDAVFGSFFEDNANFFAKVIFGSGDGSYKFPKLPYWKAAGMNELGYASTDKFAVTKGVIIRGFRYGLANVLPKFSSAVYRRDSFGHIRDMLEQRQYTRFFTEDGLEEGCVSVNFVERGTNGTQASDPMSTNSSNLDIFCSSSLPYRDGHALDRESQQPDTAEKVSIAIDIGLD